VRGYPSDTAPRHLTIRKTKIDFPPLSKFGTFKSNHARVASLNELHWHW
jgi:hypothetical protein